MRVSLPGRVRRGDGLPVPLPVGVALVYGSDAYQHRTRRRSRHRDHAALRRCDQDRGGRPRSPASRRPTHDPGRSSGDARGPGDRRAAGRPTAARGVILADTSAWVEYDRATGSHADLRLAELLERPRTLAVTEPVVMEVVAGARDHQREIDLLDLLARATLIPFDAVADFHA